MPGTEKRTISLPVEQAAFIDEKVRAGDYASVSEVVRAGLRELKARDAAIERWLEEDVARAYDLAREDPDRAMTLDAAFEKLRDGQKAITRR